MYKDELSVFIPNSFLSESKDLKVRTFKVGILGRALAVFQIDNVVIYNDDHIKNENGEEDGEFIAEVLNYMNTPQYLRKSAFPIRPELKHVGILPPLRAPHHPVNSQPDVGDYRQGFTVKRNKKGTFVDIGMDKLAFCKEQLTVKKIFNLLWYSVFSFILPATKLVTKNTPSTTTLTISIWASKRCIYANFKHPFSKLVF